MIMIVYYKGKYNIKKKDGTYLSEKWFDKCYEFVNGYDIMQNNIGIKYEVELDCKFTYVKEDGTYLTDDWFDACNSFYCGFGLVKKKNMYNYLKEDGTYLSKKWFEQYPKRLVNNNSFYGMYKTHSIYFLIKRFKIKLID